MLVCMLHRPFLLPCLVSSVMSFLSILQNIVMLQETLPSRAGPEQQYHLLSTASSMMLSSQQHLKHWKGSATSIFGNPTSLLSRARQQSLTAEYTRLSSSEPAHDGTDHKPNSSQINGAAALHCDSFTGVVGTIHSLQLVAMPSSEATHLQEQIEDAASTAPSCPTAVDDDQPVMVLHSYHTATGMQGSDHNSLHQGVSSPGSRHATDASLVLDVQALQAAHIAESGHLSRSVVWSGSNERVSMHEHTALQVPVSLFAVPEGSATHEHQQYQSGVATQFHTEHDETADHEQRPLLQPATHHQHSSSSDPSRPRALGVDTSSDSTVGAAVDSKNGMDAAAEASDIKWYKQGIVLICLAGAGIITLVLNFLDEVSLSCSRQYSRTWVHSRCWAGKVADDAHCLHTKRSM